MPEPRYPFIVPFDGQPHPARLSDDCEHLLIRVMDLETGPVEHAQEFGGPVGSVVRDLWAALGRTRELVYAEAYAHSEGSLRVGWGRWCRSCGLEEPRGHQPGCRFGMLLAEDILRAAGSEWQRLKQVEVALATANLWRLPSDRPEPEAPLRVVRRGGWGSPPLRMYFVADGSGFPWREVRGPAFMDSEIEAWQYEPDATMPEGWPGSAPEAAAPSPSSGGVDDAGNEYTLGGGR